MSARSRRTVPPVVSPVDARRDKDPPRRWTVAMARREKPQPLNPEGEGGGAFRQPPARRRARARTHRLVSCLSTNSHVPFS
jgi:hypothetical protein